MPAAHCANTTPDTNILAIYAVSRYSQASGPRAVPDPIGWLRDRLRRLVHPHWHFFRPNDNADELILGHHGPVEIRQTLAGWSLETCVKGEPDRARETALRRLGNFVAGRNRAKVRLRVAPPLVQSAEGVGRWRVRVALPGLDNDLAAGPARNGKVRLHARGSETLAVLSVPGRPSKLAIQHAETAIRHAIAVTRWLPSGPAMLRLHTQPAVLPFLGRFEIAVPVVERMHGRTATEWLGRTAFDQPMARDAATQSTPPVH
jgi:SOUL heme-binding protein